LELKQNVVVKLNEILVVIYWYSQTCFFAIWP